MVCSKCGNHNPDDVKYCAACGAEQNQQPPPAESSASGQATPNNGSDQQPQGGGFSQATPNNRSDQQPQGGGFSQAPPNTGSNWQPQGGGFSQATPNNGSNWQPQGGGFSQATPNNGSNWQPQGGGFGQQPFVVPPVNDSKKKLLIIGGAGAAVAALILVFVLIFALGSSPQKAANKFAKGANSGNAKMVAEAMMPEDAIKKIETKLGKSINSALGADEFEDLTNLRITVNDKANIDRDEISNFIDNLENLDIKVSEAECRKIELSYSKDGKNKNKTDEAVFYKSGGKWYMIPY